jgi:hypothetical protein
MVMACRHDPTVMASCPCLLITFYRCLIVWEWRDVTTYKGVGYFLAPGRSKN